MILRETLTKENFWNAIMQKFPHATKSFCDWIDQYKSEVNWNLLFNSGAITRTGETIAPKFHELPYAFQVGIWHEFVRFALNDYEQPEHELLNFDFEENIEELFAGIESDLADEAASEADA